MQPIIILLLYNLQTVLFVLFSLPLIENELMIFQEPFVYTGEINRSLEHNVSGLLVKSLRAAQGSVI
jgi:hypothetical protein